jgi:HEAT repeat protein
LPSYGPPDVEKLKAEGDVKGLIKALGYQKDPRIRCRAADALGSFGDAGVVEFLMQALKDDSWTVRKAAAQSLGQMRDARAVEPFIAALEGGTEDVRKAAAKALGQIGDVSAVEPLLAALREDSWGVRAAAAGALALIGDVRAVGPLGDTLRDADLGVREAAADALIRIGAPALELFVSALQDHNWDVRRTAARALGQIRDARAVGPLSAALRDPQDSWLRRAAAVALGQIGDASSVESLVAALHDPDALVRDAAAEALAARGWQPARPGPQVGGGR